MMRSQRRLQLVAAMTVASVLTASAGAQTQDGRALDNNLMVGSGGVNAARQYDFGSGNAMVTGNVAGLDYFRGDVGYTAPGDFTGELGGDSTFRFRAQSLPIGVAQPRGLGATGLAGQGSQLRVYRDAGTPGIGTVGAVGTTRTPSSLMAAPSPSATGLRVYQQPGDQIGETDTLGGRIGYVLDQDGRVMQMTASPLRGLHTQPVDAQGRAISLRQQAEIDQYTAQFQAAGQLPDEDEGPAGNLSVRPDPRMSTGLDTRVTTPADLTLDQQIEAIATRQAGEQGSRQVQPGSDVYTELMTRIQAQRGETPPSAPEQESRIVPLDQQSPTTAPTTGGTEQPGMVEGAAPGPVTFEGAQMRPPSIEQMLEAEAQRREAELSDAQRRAAAGLPPLQADEAAEEDQQQTGPVVPETLAYKLPPLPSLAAADRTDRVNTLLREAEQLIVEGAYFRALDRYRQAGDLTKSNPMIHVGRLHAQLGGGMLRSAAVTARQLFEAHPELIAARYDARLLPAADRLETIREQLEELAAATEDRSSDPGLLLAYVGYQTGTADLTRYGLDLAAAAHPNDPLLALLRGIWLQGSAGSASESAEPQPTTPDEHAPVEPAEQPLSEPEPADAAPADATEPADAEPVEALPAESVEPADGHDSDEDPPHLDLDALDAALEPEK